MYCSFNILFSDVVVAAFALYFKFHGPYVYQSNSVLFVVSRWRFGQMTNFQYLTELNKMAGRSFNDLMQYPVFPFVLADFGHEVLDLTDDNSFRYCYSTVFALPIINALQCYT